MCHQSVGLIAREIERRGIATVSLSSAYSITRAAFAPRAVYLDFPLGRTAGKAGDVAMQRHILRAALARLRDAEAPGEIVQLPYRWADTDDWKDGVMRPQRGASEGARDDARSERLGTPQYQTEEDAALADPGCPTCIFPDTASPAARA